MRRIKNINTKHGKEGTRRRKKKVLTKFYKREA